MTRFFTHIHGHAVELRIGDLGGETALVNGRVVSSRPFAGWWSGSNRFEMADESGSVRHVELTARAVGSLKRLVSYVLDVRVDGIARATLEPEPSGRKPGMCVNCGYDLAGLVPVPGPDGKPGVEVRCPECGRHSVHVSH